MSKIFVLQQKGGVGKSTLTKLLFLKAEKEEKDVVFIDCDNASGTTTKFFLGLEKRKPKNILYKPINIVGKDKKIDRTKFDKFLEIIDGVENVVVDFGAASSEQMLFYIQEEEKNGIVEDFKNMGILIYLVVAGGGSITECAEYALELKKIDGIIDITKIVANEFLGGVNGKTVAEFSNADIIIKGLTDDVNSDAQIEWNEALKNGILYSDIGNMSTRRQRRVKNYLEETFATL